MSHAASRCSARSEAKKVQFRAVANPTSQPREERRPACEHAGNITGHVKSQDFSLLSEFLVATAVYLVSVTAAVGVRTAGDGCEAGTWMMRAP